MNLIPNYINFSHEFEIAFEALSLETFGYEFIVRDKLSTICTMLYQYYKQEIEIKCLELNQDDIRIRQMLNYIHIHYSENINLSQIAKVANIGKRECLRCFQRMIQVSPVQYLLKYRVTQGTSMLIQNPNNNISEIASRCGFESPIYHI